MWGRESSALAAAMPGRGPRRGLDLQAHGRRSISTGPQRPMPRLFFRAILIVKIHSFLEFLLRSQADKLAASRAVLGYAFSFIV